MRFVGLSSTFSKDRFVPAPPVWWVRSICLRRLNGLLNDWPHLSQCKSLVEVCFFICSVKLLFRLNVLLQISQIYFCQWFSVLLCWISWLNLGKVAPHVSQEYSIFSVKQCISKVCTLLVSSGIGLIICLVTLAVGLFELVSAFLNLFHFWPYR